MSPRLSLYAGSGTSFQAETPIRCLWVAAYSVSVGPLGYVYLAETSTVLLRAKTTSTAAMGTGLLNLVVNYCTPLMLNAPGFGVSSTGEFAGPSMPRVPPFGYREVSLALTQMLSVPVRWDRLFRPCHLLLFRPRNKRT